MSYQEYVTSKECHLHLIKYILESRILDTPEYIHTYVLVSQRNMSACVVTSYRWPNQFLPIFKFYGTLFFTIFHHGTATGWSVLKMSQKVLLLSYGNRRLIKTFLSNYHNLFTFIWAELTQKSLQVTVFIMKGKPSDPEVRQPVLEFWLYCVLTG